jgi:hypothetical protein
VVAVTFVFQDFVNHLTVGCPWKRAASVWIVGGLEEAPRRIGGHPQKLGRVGGRGGSFRRYRWRIKEEGGCWICFRDGEGGKSGAGSGIADGMENVTEAGFDDGGGVSNGHGYDMGKPCKVVGNEFGIGRLDVDLIASVGVHGGANIPAFDAMGRPGFALGGLVMDNYFDARGCYGVMVEVELAMDLCPGQEVGVDARA